MGCRANTGRHHSCRLGRPRGWRGRPRPAANAARSRWSRSPGQRCHPPAARGWRDYPTGPWPTPRAGLAPLFALFYQVEIRHRHSAAIVAGSRPVIMPLAVTRAFSPRALSRGSALRQPQRGRVADQYQLDSLAEQRLGLAREECRGGNGRLVAAGDPAAERIARPALFERPPTYPLRRLWCELIHHRHLLRPATAPFRH